jgi:putative ABC transport system permease protein
VLPPVSESGEFGEGVVVSVLSEQCGSASPSSSASCVNDLVAENSPDPASDLLVRFRRGVDVPETIERMRAKIHAGDDQGLFLTDAGDLVNFGRVDDMPVILAGLLALLSAAALTHLLFSSVSRRRRDHAVLKTLGFTRGQVRRAYAWQATTTLIAALVFAIPLGIVAGRGLWVFLAQRLGVVAEPRVARLAVALTPLVALVLANVIAAVPARAAARTLPATVLRAE